MWPPAVSSPIRAPQTAHRGRAPQWGRDSVRTGRIEPASPAVPRLDHGGGKPPPYGRRTQKSLPLGGKVPPQGADEGAARTNAGI